MDNKRFREEATKKLAECQLKLVSKDYLISEIRYLMDGLDKAKNYTRWKALAECMVIIEKAKEH